MENRSNQMADHRVRSREIARGKEAVLCHSDDHDDSTAKDASRFLGSFSQPGLTPPPIRCSSPVTKLLQSV